MFGAIIAFVIITNVIYPRWIEPLTTLDERMVAARERLDELEQQEQRIEGYREEYRALVSRIGTFDIDREATAVRDRINALIDKHKLRADSVAPSRARTDRKTEIESMTINVKAVGPLESAIGFLADLYELPQFMQVGNVALYPGSTKANERGPTPMNLRVPIQIAVLPQQKIVGRIDLEETEQPDKRERHAARDYSPIWSGTPFDDWIPPVPLRVEIKPSKTVANQGEKVWLQGGATGGVGSHTFVWSPTDGLKNPDSSRTELDTEQPGARTFTLTATDEKGETASNSVTINITPKPESIVRNNDRPPPPPPPPPPADSRWKDRMQRQLVMTLGRSGEDGRLDELMVSNRRSNGSEYYAVNEDFDGGTLIYVHQTGGLVRRKDDPRHPKGEEGYYVYPIGETLDKDIPIAQAEAFPELRRAAEMDKAASAAEHPESEAQAAGEIQPRGAEEVPMQIGLVGQPAGVATERAQQVPDGGQNQAAKPADTATEREKREGRSRGRRPIPTPK